MDNFKVVQINADYNKGSIGRTTYEVHQYLRENNNDSYVFTCEVNEPENNVFQIGNRYDHKLHALLSKLLGRQGFYSHWATHNLLRRLDAINPDLVQLRNLHNNYINYPMLLKYLAERDIATVITLHDCWFLTGKCCYYTSLNCAKWQTGCEHCPALKKDNVSWFFDRSKADHQLKMKLLNDIPRLAIVGNSKWTTEQGKQSLIKNAKIIKCIYNWIDMGTFKYHDPVSMRLRLGIPENAFVVIGVAMGWSERKGLHVFETLAKKMPEITFVLVGTFYDNRILPKNVIKYGRTQNTDELSELYSLADVFLNPSTQETFGKVTAEAMCCGTPAIVNNATANPELIGHQCGYIVSENNIEEYCKYIKEVRRNGRAFYSQNCLDFVSSNFNKKDRIADYLSLYNELINWNK